MSFTTNLRGGLALPASAYSPVYTNLANNLTSVPDSTAQQLGDPCPLSRYYRPFAENWRFKLWQRFNYYNYFSPEILFNTFADDHELIKLQDGIFKKPSANIDNLNPKIMAALPAIYEAFEKFGYADLYDTPIVITSGNDSDHLSHSYHYKDRAIDIRGKHVPDDILKKIGAEIKTSLGKDFRVLVELFSVKDRDRDHIHVAYLG